MTFDAPEDTSRSDAAVRPSFGTTPSRDGEGLTPDTSRAAVSVSGILLVGGASRRFGSPKALACFRGETLAERAWRLLGEVCEERIAVGKRADELPLPFPLLDDGVEERAPAYGLLAGLRAASHEVCLALPVDCPLLTAEALRTLVDARAVPQTGPLPGAYERGMAPELERRLASGELSLRGLNPQTVELEGTVLANANTPGELAALSEPLSARR